MGMSAFNRARRLAAEATQSSSAAPPAAEPIPRNAREAELKALGWRELQSLLEQLGLDADRPKGVSWDDFAIPQILTHEGL